MNKVLVTVLAILAVAFVIAAPGQMATAGEVLEFEEDNFHRGPRYNQWNDQEFTEEELREWEKWHEERDEVRNEVRIEQIERAIEEGEISETEGRELISAIEKNDDFSSSTCPMGGPGSMNFGPRFNEFERDYDEESWNFQGGYDNHRGPGRSRGGGFGDRQGW